MRLGQAPHADHLVQGDAFACRHVAPVRTEVHLVVPLGRHGHALSAEGHLVAGHALVYVSTAGRGVRRRQLKILVFEPVVYRKRRGCALPLVRFAEEDQIVVAVEPAGSCERDGRGLYARVVVPVPEARALGYGMLYEL
nr:MAG TPA: hypothetical protein [Caudoviricetes sp.]